MAKREKTEGGGHLGGVFKGLADLIEKLGDLAEKGAELKRSGEFQQKDLKGVYGFSVKMGRGEQGEENIRVEPFGNVRRDEKSGKTVVQEVREPLVDVFEEKDYTLVVAEMPGISTKNVRLEVKDDLLTIYAEKQDKKYRKEILLPRAYPLEKMQMSCNNGILEIKCTRLGETG